MALFDVADVNVSVPTACINVRGALDASDDHYIQYRYEGGWFSIDTQNPQVAGATPSLSLVADADVGYGNFTLTVAYGEPMKNTVAPTIAFTPDATATPPALTFAGGTWTDGTHYVATYNVTHNGAPPADVAIDVTGAQDLLGNTQVPFSAADVFRIDTSDLAPTDLYAIGVSTTEIELAWTDDCPNSTGYIIQSSPDGENSWTFVTNEPLGVTARDYHNTGLAGEGSLRYYRILALGFYDDSPYSDPAIGATLLETPTDFDADAYSGQLIDVSWTDNSAVETGYSIQQLMDEEYDDWQEVAWIEGHGEATGAMLASVSGAFEPATEYTFRVVAYSDWSYSLPSDDDSTTTDAWPEAPTELTATLGSISTEIDLAWTASSGAVYYSIERQEQSDGYWTSVDTGDLDFTSATTCTVTVTAGGASYSFRVSAHNTNGDSAFSEPTEFVETDNAAPEILDISAGSNPVTGISTSLSATVTDDGDPEDLTYWWSVSPPTGGDAWFDDETSATSQIYFTAAGEYYVTLDVDDGHEVTGAQRLTTQGLTIAVDQALTSIVVTPNAAAVVACHRTAVDTKQFAATALDQFGDVLYDQPTFDWAVVGGGGGTITSGGLYTPPAGAVDAATYMISASAAGLSGTVSTQASVLVEPWVATEQLDTLTFDNGGYTQTDDQTVTWASEGVTFTCPESEVLTVGFMRRGGGSGNLLYAGTVYDGYHDEEDESHDGSADMTITFDAPRGVESFDVVGRLNTVVCPVTGDRCNVGSMTLHLANSQTLTIDLDPHGELIHQYITGCCVTPGDPPYNDDVDFQDTVSLSQYGPLTQIDLHPNRIVFRNYADPGEEPWWCEGWHGGQEFGIDNLKFAELKASRLDLTVIEAAHQLNQTTAIDATRDLYVAADANGNVTVQVTPGSALMTTTDGNIYSWPYTHLHVEPLGGGEALLDETYAQFHSENSGADTMLLHATPSVRDFAILAWLDENQSGDYDWGEATREVDVHVVTLESLTVSEAENANNTVTATWTTTPDLYLAGDADGIAHVDLSALFTFQQTHPDEAGQFIHVSIVRSDGVTIIDGKYNWLEDAAFLADLPLRTTATAQDFTVHCSINADSLEAYVHVYRPAVDLDIDSDNTASYAGPSRNDQEEYLEQNRHGLGKLIAPNCADRDGDGVLNCWEGYYLRGAYLGQDRNNASEAFIPIVVELAAGMDYSQAQVEFDYYLASVFPPGNKSVVPTFGDGAIRIWTKDGVERRDGSYVTDDPKWSGNLVPRDRALTAASLGFSDTNRTVTLYVEGVTENFHIRSLTEVQQHGKPQSAITIKLYPTGDTTARPITDTVNYIVGGPQTFYYQLLNHEELRAALAARGIYTRHDLPQWADMPEFCLQPLTSIQELKDAGFSDQDAADLVADKAAIGFGAGVYHDYISGDNILAFEGTNGANYADWYTNIQQGVGHETQQYDAAMLIAHDLKDLWNNPERTTPTVFMPTAPAGWIIAGHSLGGGLAAAASMVSGFHAFTFNAAGVHLNTLVQSTYCPSLTSDEEMHSASLPLITSYVVDYDILNCLQDRLQDGLHWLTWLDAGFPVPPTSLGTRFTLTSGLGYDIGLGVIEFVAGWFVPGGIGLTVVGAETIVSKMVQAHSYYLQSLLPTYGIQY